MIRIHFTYRHVDKPWGGANNFIRALRAELQSSGNFVFTDSPNEPSDIVFMNQLGTGPGGSGKVYSLAEVKKLRGQGRRIVVRAVNLNRHAFRLGPRNVTLGWWCDRQTVALLNLADVAIFQSNYQRDFFRRAGYCSNSSEVIHNGAPPEFWVEQSASPPLDGPLRLVSSTASPRESKRHDLIARLSLCDGVEIRHLGAWPEGLSVDRVQLLGMLPREKMIKAMADCHYFLHAAIKDPCPNAVFEAVCAGLPAIYNPGPGSSAEIIGSCGLALNEANLARTVAEARDRFNDLRCTVLTDRARFAIGYAAARYRDVFERQAGF